MFDAVIDKITSDAYSELFFLFSGSLILYASQKTYTKVKEIKYKLRLRSEIAAYKKRKDAINVLDLANGDPEFEKKNIFSREISIFGAHRSLFVGMPSKIKDEISSRERDAGYMDSQLSKFNSDTSFNGEDSFQDIAELTGITELPELIKKHKFIVGKNF